MKPSSSLIKLRLNTETLIYPGGLEEKRNDGPSCVSDQICLCLLLLLMNIRFDAAVWIKNNLGDSDRQRHIANDGLKIAGSGDRRDEGISVLMSVDKDEATRRRERELGVQAGGVGTGQMSGNPLF